MTESENKRIKKFRNRGKASDTAQLSQLEERILIYLNFRESLSTPKEKRNFRNSSGIPWQPNEIFSFWGVEVTELKRKALSRSLHRLEKRGTLIKCLRRNGKGVRISSVILLPNGRRETERFRASGFRSERFVADDQKSYESISRAIDRKANINLVIASSEAMQGEDYLLNASQVKIWFDEYKNARNKAKKLDQDYVEHIEFSNKVEGFLKPFEQTLLESISNPRAKMLLTELQSLEARKSQIFQELFETLSTVL